MIQYRVAGIPAATDFSAIQRRQDKVTYWLYTQDPRINHINTSSIANLRIGKIYRQTFSSNPAGDQGICPSFFKDPFNKDVTDLYLHTADISIDIPATVHTEYAYLAVYDDVTWQPVAYSPIQKRERDISTNWDEIVSIYRYIIPITGYKLSPHRLY